MHRLIEIPRTDNNADQLVLVENGDKPAQIDFSPVAQAHELGQPAAECPGPPHLLQVQAREQKDCDECLRRTDPEQWVQWQVPDPPEKQQISREGVIECSGEGEEQEDKKYN